MDMDFTTTYAVAQAFTLDILEGGEGGTAYTVSGIADEPFGFVVGGAAGAEIVLKREAYNGPDDLSHAISQGLKALQNMLPASNYRANGLGYWVHEGKVYLDAVTWTNDERAAEKWARQRGELAYYDRRADTSVYMPEV